MGPVSDDEPDLPPADEPEPTEPTEPEPAKPARPTAVPVTSPGVQIATVAIAIVVVVVVALVFVFQSGKDGPGTGPTESTEVPQAPPSDYVPSRDETLPAVPEVPASLCPSVSLTRPLTVLSFNIHGAEAHSGEQRLEQVADEITAWKPDIVLLQEVDENRARSNGVRQAEVLGDLTDLHWAYGGAQQVRDGGPIGNAILSAYPIKESTNILLPRAGGREQRAAIHAVLNVDGAAISVYSTHFDQGSSDARIAQAQALGKAIAADPRPKIVGGDLNVTPTAQVVKILRAARLGDVWAVGDGVGATVPAYSPRRRIDYILHDGWFQPLQSVVLRSAVSDHRAVWSRIEFREELGGCIKVGG